MADSRRSADANVSLAHEMNSILTDCRWMSWCGARHGSRLRHTRRSNRGATAEMRFGRARCPRRALRRRPCGLFDADRRRRRLSPLHLAFRRRIRHRVRQPGGEDQCPRVRHRRLADGWRARFSTGSPSGSAAPIAIQLTIIRSSIESRASPVREQRGLLQLARQQLGTVGSGNHYVDLLEDEEGRRLDRRPLRVSRVRPPHRDRLHAHRAGRRLDDGRGEGEMDAPPLLLALDAPGGQDYFEAMTIAGEYAYAGREAVVERVRANPRRERHRERPQPSQFRVARGARR